MCPSQYCSCLHSQHRLPGTFPVKPKITHAAEQRSSVLLEVVEWESEPDPADSCLRTEKPYREFAGNVASMKAESLLIFVLNYNHSPILLHSISEQLHNISSTFLQGTSMCESVNITWKKQMLEQHVNVVYYLFLSSSHSCPSFLPRMAVTTLNIGYLPLSHIIMSSVLQEEKVAVAKAKDFLESNTYSAEDPYTTALAAYALALLRSPYAPLALRRLNHMAITQGTATPTVPSPQPGDF